MGLTAGTVAEGTERALPCLAVYLLDEVENLTVDRMVSRRGFGAHSSIADVFRTTLDLFDTGLDLMRQNLRRRHPDADDQEIARLLETWLRERPGAAGGDCAGRSVDVETRLA